MKLFQSLAVLTLASLVCGVGGAQEEPAAFDPSHPRIGEPVTVTYIPEAKGATLRGLDSLALQTLVMRPRSLPELIETPLKREGAGWKGTLTIRDASARLLLFRFVSGEKVDDNGENVWFSMLYGSDWRPLEGSHLQRAMDLETSGFQDFKHPKDMEAAQAEVSKELELYPSSWLAHYVQWTIMMRETPGDSTLEVIRSQLDSVYERHQDDQDAVAAMLTWFARTGQKSRADDIMAKAMARDPSGKVAQSQQLNQIFDQNDVSRRIPLLERYLKDFALTEQDRDTYSNYLMSLYIQTKHYDSALAALTSMKDPDPAWYNSIARALIRDPVTLDEGVSLAEKGVRLTRAQGDSRKPGYMSESEWKKTLTGRLASILDTYATGLVGQHHGGTAEPLFAEAFRLSGANDSHIGQRYLECLLSNKDPGKAMNVASELIRSGSSPDTVVALYRSAYVKVKGSGRGFDDSVSVLKAAARAAAMKKLLSERIDKPAIDFSLKGTDGKVVRLSELRGKVVVLDFWATWCGPCKASFPYLQKVYDAYRSNPRVAFLALDTWEQATGADRESLVKKFLESNRYTFPVLYDEGFVEKYGVDGIPTKFVIDRDGKIQFKSVGFEGGQEMIDSLTLEIDMLLSGRFPSSGG